MRLIAGLLVYLVFLGVVYAAWWTASRLYIYYLCWRDSHATR